MPVPSAFIISFRGRVGDVLAAGRHRSHDELAANLIRMLTKGQNKPELFEPWGLQVIVRDDPNPPVRPMIAGTSSDPHSQYLTFLLRADVIAALKASGHDWRNKVDDILREHLIAGAPE